MIRFTRRSIVNAAVTAARDGPASTCPLARPAQEKVLTVGNPFSPLSMDPSLSGNGRAGTHLLPAYEPLVRVTADGSFEPALATAWAMSPDSKSATFTLRQDAKFSDGEPVNAEAVKKSIEYWRTKKGGPFAVNLATVTSIDVVEPYKVRINVSAPNPALLNLFEAYWLAGNIISPKALCESRFTRQRNLRCGPLHARRRGHRDGQELYLRAQPALLRQEPRQVGQDRDERLRRPELGDPGHEGRAGESAGQRPGHRPRQCRQAREEHAHRQRAGAMDRPGHRRPQRHRQPGVERRARAPGDQSFDRPQADRQGVARRLCRPDASDAGQGLPWA